MAPTRSHSSPIRTLALVATVALLFALPGAVAQASNLDVTVPADAVEAMPMGSPGVLNVTVAYTCLTTISTITVTAEIKNDAPGTATLETEAVEPQTPPDCTPGDTVQETIGLSYVPDMNTIAGTEVEIDVTATHDPSGQGAGDSMTKPAKFSVGPYVDVTFTPNATSLEGAAGDEIPVSVAIESKSNTLVMAMPSVDGLPPTWSRPDTLPRNVKSPLEDGEDGMDTLSFMLQIPADASGEVTFELTMFAHSLTDTYMQTPEETIPFTVMVAPGDATTSGGGNGDSDSEESPSVGLVPLLVVGALLVAWGRRRVR